MANTAINVPKKIVLYIYNRYKELRLGLRFEN